MRTSKFASCTSFSMRSHSGEVPSYSVHIDIVMHPDHPILAQYHPPFESVKGLSSYVRSFVELVVATV